MIPRPDQLAEAQFRLRLANARRMVAEGKVDRARAEAALRPWASIALRCGADLPELTPEATGYVVWQITPPGAIPPEEVAAMHAEALCPFDRCLAALQTARDQAIDRGDWDSASPLIRLGEFLGPLQPYLPAESRPRDQNTKAGGMAPQGTLARPSPSAAGGRDNQQTLEFAA